MRKSSDIFKSLSEEIRLKIVILLTEGELCVCDFIEVLNLPQSTISRHMAKLKKAGFISDRRDGKWVHYSLTKIEDFPDKELYEILLQLKKRPTYLRDLDKLKKHLKLKKCKQD